MSANDVPEGYEIESQFDGWIAVCVKAGWRGPKRLHRVRAEADASEDAALRSLARQIQVIHPPPPKGGIIK